MPWLIKLALYLWSGGSLCPLKQEITFRLNIFTNLKGITTVKNAMYTSHNYKIRNKIFKSTLTFIFILIIKTKNM